MNVPPITLRPGNLDAAAPGRLVGNVRMFDNSDGHAVLAGLGVGVLESGGLKVGEYSYAAEYAAAAAGQLHISIGPGAGRSWRLECAAGWIVHGGVRQIDPADWIEIVRQGQSDVLPALAGSSPPAGAAGAVPVGSVGLTPAAAGPGHVLAYPGTILQAGDLCRAWLTAVGIGDEIHLAVAYAELTLGARPPL